MWRAGTVGSEPVQAAAGAAEAVEVGAVAAAEKAGAMAVQEAGWETVADWALAAGWEVVGWEEARTRPTAGLDRPTRARVARAPHPVPGRSPTMPGRRRHA